MKIHGNEKGINLMEIMKAAVEKGNHEAGDEEEPLIWLEPDENPQTSSLEEAIAIAVHAHKCKVDKAGAPYIPHPLRVMFQRKRAK